MAARWMRARPVFRGYDRSRHFCSGIARFIEAEEGARSDDGRELATCASRRSGRVTQWSFRHCLQSTTARYPVYGASGRRTGRMKGIPDSTETKFGRSSEPLPNSCARLVTPERIKEMLLARSALSESESVALIRLIWLLGQIDSSRASKVIDSIATLLRQPATTRQVLFKEIRKIVRELESQYSE